MPSTPYAWEFYRATASFRKDTLRCEPTSMVSAGQVRAMPAAIRHGPTRRAEHALQDETGPLPYGRGSVQRITFETRSKAFHAPSYLDFCPFSAADFSNPCGKPRGSDF